MYYEQLNVDSDAFSDALLKVMTYLSDMFAALFYTFKLLISGGDLAPPTRESQQDVG